MKIETIYEREDSIRLIFLILDNDGEADKVSRFGFVYDLSGDLLLDLLINIGKQFVFDWSTTLP